MWARQRNLLSHTGELLAHFDKMLESNLLRTGMHAIQAIPACYSDTSLVQGLVLVLFQVCTISRITYSRYVVSHL